MFVQTEKLMADKETEVAIVGDGVHIHVENRGDGIVYASKYPNVVAESEDVIAIDKGITKLIPNVCVYSSVDNELAYRGNLYVLSTAETSIEITSTNNSNFKQIAKGGGDSNDSVSNFITNSDCEMISDIYVSQYLGAYKETLGIVTQPLDVVLSSEITSVDVKVVASGEELKYQWYVWVDSVKMWVATGTTSKTDTMTITKGTYSQFKCVITDKYNNSVTSDICTVTILEEE